MRHDDYGQPPDAPRPWYDEVSSYDQRAFAALRTAHPPQQPLPDFKPCDACELRRSCAAARHCAREPRKVEQPVVPNTPSKENTI